jgi:hypothetical protein
LARTGKAVDEQGQLGPALRRARLAEAAHYDAALGLRDAKAIRLQILKDDLDVIVSSSPEARAMFDLALLPGEVPRLWVDFITSVVMEPDPKTYRLVQDSQGARDTLLETPDRAELVERLKQLMAHRIIARNRQMASVPETAVARRTYSPGSLVLSFLAGLALALVLSFIYLKIFRIIP